MAQYKLKKGQNLGSLSAETDSMLERVFVDTGYMSNVQDPADPHFLLIGRTGSGKTALVKMLAKTSEHASNLDPDELSMQYIHSNPVLKKVAGWGIHLDIFFKFLWRHVCVLELIKMRYSSTESTKAIIDRVRGWLFVEKKTTQSLALNYLEDHGHEYWVTADTHVKAFTYDLENRIKTDENIEARLTPKLVQVGGREDTSSEDASREHLEIEIVDRVQAIVNDYQVAALNEVVARLGKHSFNDDKKRYYLIIDDLDKNWMPDDTLYLDLLKSLLYTVKELNQKLSGVKILVAMRTNIFFRVFHKTKQSEPQREKWFDVIHEVKWSKSELCDMLNKRLAQLFKGQYTKEPPTYLDILPPAKRKNKVEAIDYILERTFYRPRDVIAFMNSCFEQSVDGSLAITWSKIERAEIEYSKNRLNSLIDEWKDSYFGLSALFSLLEAKGEVFSLADISDNDVNNIFANKNSTQCSWLASLLEQFCKDQISFEEIKVAFVNALYLVGLVGLKRPQEGKVSFSYEHSLNLIGKTPDHIAMSTIHVHRMFWKALRIDSGQQLR